MKMSESSRAIDKKLLVNNSKARANILIADEFRMIDLDIINKVLRRFLSSPREPKYLTKKKYAHLAERNKEIYMSSAWYQSHWSFNKVRAYFLNMMNNRSYFCCSLPYQISILEGLLMRTQIEDEMSEEDFDMTTFSMEMEALFYGDADGSFFKFSDIDPCRKLKNAFFPLEYYINKKKSTPKLALGEERILSADIALMSSSKKKRNDASSLIINSAVPLSNGDFQSNIVFIENHEGLTSGDLALTIMRTFYEFNCTQLVIDTNGVGMGVYDALIKDQYDEKTGKTYRAFTCCNDQEMADRCKVKDANKCLWSIKASDRFNSDMAASLRTGFQNRRINLLIDEYKAEEMLRQEISGYDKLKGKQQAVLKIPYVQTSYLIHEIIELEYEIKNNNIRVKEKSGERKDRYSSLGYNYYVMNEIAMSKKPKDDNTDLVNILAGATKLPKSYKKFM